MGNNILLNKTATASSFVMPYAPSKIVDGTATPFNRWLCNTLPGWITIDAGAAFWVNRWVIKLMGNAGWAYNYNMPAYTLQTSIDNYNWTTVDSVAANTANTTDRSFATISARYFRISISSGIAINSKLASIMEFEVYDAPAPNGLIGLTISSGTLSPSFANQVLNYTDSVGTDVASVTLTPTASVAGATITVDGAAVSSGSASQAINLTAGTAKTIPIVVTTNNQPKTYNVAVMRQTSAYLTNITLASGGKKQPVMDPYSRNTFAYNATTYATPVTINIKKEDTAATLLVTCGGTALTASTPSADGSIPYSAPLNAGSNAVVIKVTSSTGDVKNYTITIAK